MSKRIVACLLTIILVISVMPLNAFAGNIDFGKTGKCVVSCGQCVTGQNMPRRSGGAAIDTTIKNGRGSPLPMLFIEKEGGSISGWNPGNYLPTSVANNCMELDNNGNYMWAYCIEHGNHLNGNDNQKVSAKEDSAYWRSLSYDATTGMEMTLLCGFPNQKSWNGVTTACDLYAATQIIIWEFQTGYRTIKKDANGRQIGTETHSGVTYSYIGSDNTEKTGYVKDETANFGTTTKNAYNGLLATINACFTDPIFDTNNVKLTWNGSKYTGTITCTNGVLGNFDITSSGGTTASISGNKINISTNNPNLGTANLELTHKVANCNSKHQELAVFVTANTVEKSTHEQVCVAGRTKDPISTYVKAAVEPIGGLQITKKDENGTLVEGFTFKVSGPSGTKKITTDKNGVATWDNIEIGTYSISEDVDENKVKPFNKYVIKNISDVNVTAKSTSADITITSVMNERTKATFQIYKTDGKTVTPVSGATFKLIYDGDYTINGTKVKSGADVTSAIMTGLDPSNGLVTTDNDGRANIKKLHIYDDNGDAIHYKFIEVDAPEGYLVSQLATSDSTVNKFTLENKDGKTLKVTELDEFEDGVIDDYILQQIRVAKKGEVLTGYTEETITVGEKVDEERDIAPDTYYYYKPVYEEKYIKDAVYDIYVVNDVTFCDDKTTDKIEYYKDDDNIEYKAGTLVDTLITTDKANKSEWAISKELPIGTYKVIERDAPDGFYNGNGHYEVVTLPDGQEHDKEIHDVNVDANFVNDRIKLTIDFNKRIETNENYPENQEYVYKEVAYAVYCSEDIYNSNGELIYPVSEFGYGLKPLDIITLEYDEDNSTEDEIDIMKADGTPVTDKDGNILKQKNHLYKDADASDLPIGNYILKEIRTDSEYWLDETKYSINFKDEVTCEDEGVNDAGKITKITRYDQDIKELQVMVYKVDEDGNPLMCPLENYPIRSDIEFYKKSLDGDELANVTFGVWRSDTSADEYIEAYNNATSDEERANITEGTAPIYTIVTDTDGYGFVEDIPAGDYYLREIQPAKVRLTESIEVEQYYLSDEQHDFTVSSETNDERVPLTIDMNEIVNVYKEGKLMATANDVPLIYTPKDQVLSDYVTEYVQTADESPLFGTMILVFASLLLLCVIKKRNNVNYLNTKCNNLG